MTSTSIPDPITAIATASTTTDAGMSEGNAPATSPDAMQSSILPILPAELALAEIIVKTLNLETDAADIDPNAPIYGEGLGLDSIDILEISLAISKHYGFQLKSDDQNNKTIYKSLRNLSAHVETRRTK